MAKRRKKQEEGAPAWVVTFGDMMSLLLTFFIMLVSMSVIKEVEFLKVIESIQQEFGFVSDQGRIPVTDLPTLSELEKLTKLVLHNKRFDHLSEAEDPGITGRKPTVQQIREGLKFTVGGQVTFDPGSAKLKPQAKSALNDVIAVLRGQNNKIEIRGHTAQLDTAPGEPYIEPWLLSYQRAHATMQYLVDQGIRGSRIRMVACGNKEPLESRVYDSHQAAVNRRIDIIVMQVLADDLDGDDQRLTSVPEMGPVAP